MGDVASRMIDGLRVAMSRARGRSAATRRSDLARNRRTPAVRVPGRVTLGIATVLALAVAPATLLFGISAVSVASATGRHPPRWC